MLDFSRETVPMTSSMKVLALFLATMALIQIFLEDVLLFSGTTGAGVPGLLDTPLVLVAVPLGFSLVLFGVLLAAALRSEGGLG